MTVTQYIMTLHLSFPLNNKLSKTWKKNETTCYFLNLSVQIMFRHTCFFKPSVQAIGSNNIIFEMFGYSSCSCWSTKCRWFYWCKCRWFYWSNYRWFIGCNCRWFNWFGCLINTLSPTLRSVLLALLHLSAYSFIFSFLVTSACLISGTRGRVDLNFLPFSNSEGDFPVVPGGVALYCRRKVNNSCFQFLPWMTAVLIAFSRVFISLSAFPFALGHPGVILRCVKPSSVSGKHLKAFTVKLRTGYMSLLINEWDIYNARRHPSSLAPLCTMMLLQELKFICADVYLISWVPHDDSATFEAAPSWALYSNDQQYVNLSIKNTSKNCVPVRL